MMRINRRTMFKAVIAGAGTMGVSGIAGNWLAQPVYASGGSATDWFRNAKYGLFVHYVPKVHSDMTLAFPVNNPTDWNNLVNGFDTDSFANQVQLTGVGYVIFTVGQTSGYYCSPNSAYDSYVGHSPSHCSSRDLILDLAYALEARGVSLLVYMPSDAPYDDSQATSALEWTQGARNINFQTKWQNIISEWSQRWGSHVRGWWFDGCYSPNQEYNFTSAPNWDSFAAAARAGNANSIIAFNPGVQNPIQAECPQEDYTAGEINDPTAVSCPGRFVTAPANATQSSNSQVQWHMLSFLGHNWGYDSATPRFSTNQVIDMTQAANANQGVVTWDTHVEADGRIPDLLFDQLRSIGGSTYDVNDSDTGIVYSGNWHVSSGRPNGDYQGDVHYTANDGDWFSYTFTGTGIHYNTELTNDEGNVDIYLDGVYQTTVKCYTSSGSVSAYTVYSVSGLSYGTHTLKAVKSGGQYMLLDALVVYR